MVNAPVPSLAVIMRGSGRHATRRTARRRGKTLLRDEGTRPGQVRDLAGLLPCDVFSRLSRATRRSQGSLPQHVSHCPRAMSECVRQARLSRAAGRVLRGAPVSAVTRAQRGKTGSQRDCRAAHGAPPQRASVRVGTPGCAGRRSHVESPFFHGVERRAGSECALRRARHSSRIDGRDRVQTLPVPVCAVPLRGRGGG
jgi:hypothetical protein